MKKYQRTNDEGNEVLDYDLLDMSQRVNFTEDVKRWASETLTGAEDRESVTKAELREWAEATIKPMEDYEGIVIDANTKDFIIDLFVGEWEETHNVAS